MGDKTTKELLSVNSIRHNNKINLLTHIVKSADVTRSRLAKKNQISVMTVKHIVDELIEDGIVNEHTSDSYLGRKPRALNISERYGNIVCINLTSVDEMSYIIYDLKEKILFREKIKIQKSQNHYKRNLLDVIEKIKVNLKDITTQTVGIAVFVPSAYYEEQDLVNYDLIADFKDLHIKSLFKNQFGIENVLVLHDAFAAAKSEYEGSNSFTDSQFYFYCGSGVGGFFIDRGNAVMGQNLVAGEVGKIILSMEPGGGKGITLEEVAAVPAIMERVKEIYPDMEFEEVFDKYDQGDKEIRKILDEVLDQISKILYNIVWLYNPTRIVVDSCYKQYSHMIRQRVETFLEIYNDSSIPVEVQICQAQYDEYHMMRGCYKLVLEKWIEELVTGSQERPREVE